MTKNKQGCYFHAGKAHWKRNNMIYILYWLMSHYITFTEHGCRQGPRISRKNTRRERLQKYTYIVFSNVCKLASANSKTAPTLKKKGRKMSQQSNRRCHRFNTSQSYRVNRRHGVVDEVIFFFLWGYSVTKANITILLIPTVTSSTDQVQTHSFKARRKSRREQKLQKRNERCTSGKS